MVRGSVAAVDKEAVKAEKLAEKMTKTALIKEKARMDFLEVTAPMRSKVLGSMKASIKSAAVADPDMWPCVKNAVNAVMEQLLSDVEKEIERSLHSALIQQQEDADQPGPSGGIFCLWYRFRAFILYHYLPHDKLMFGKLKDPVYLIIYLATLLPVHGVRILVFALLLLMLVLPGNPDEFQLINFILLCKGMQFLTSGLIQLAAGATKYFACYSLAKGDLLECINNHGPGAHDGFGLALDYLGSIALVWVAFGLLSRSEKYGADRHQKVTADEARKATQAGGRLRSLLYYDRKCFFGSLLLLLFITVCTCWEHFEEGLVDGFRGLMNDPQFQANIFWCCVGYSILSLPFAPFMISGLQEVMTHCYATGYNKNGACVPFDMPAVETDEPVPTTSSSGSMISFTTIASHATSVVNTINRGRQMRGATDNDATDVKFGDFSRGVVGYLFNVKPDQQAAQPPPTIPEEVPARDRSTSSGSEWWRGEEIARAFKNLGGGQDSSSRRNTEDLAGTSSIAVTLPIPEEPSAEEAILLSSVGTIEIPAEGIEERDSAAHFCLRVVPEGSLDAENALEVWEVTRTYLEFVELASKLGKHCYSYADAPFPKKTWNQCTGKQLEKRRVMLQAWLNACLRDPLTETEWTRPLHRFLTVEKYIEEPEAKPERAKSRKAEPEKAKQEKHNVFEDIAKVGAEARAGEGSKYKFGDFTRGLWTKVQGAKGSSAEAAAEEGAEAPAEAVAQPQEVVEEEATETPSEVLAREAPSFTEFTRDLWAKMVDGGAEAAPQGAEAAPQGAEAAPQGAEAAPQVEEDLAPVVRHESLEAFLGIPNTPMPAADAPEAPAEAASSSGGAAASAAASTSGTPSRSTVFFAEAAAFFKGVAPSTPSQATAQQEQQQEQQTTPQHGGAGAEGSSPRMQPPL